MGKARKGSFTPKNPKKYVGNVKDITYRSGWELRLMREFDKNPKITQWNSECVIINYWNPVKNRAAKYYPDFMIKMDNRVILIEVKPQRETARPVPAKKKSKTSAKRYINECATYAINDSKWHAATKRCKELGIDWWIITESNVDTFFPNVKFVLPKLPKTKSINRVRKRKKG
jgi:hypothetical protein